MAPKDESESSVIQLPNLRRDLPFYFLKEAGINMEVDNKGYKLPAFKAFLFLFIERDCTALNSQFVGMLDPVLITLPD